MMADKEYEQEHTIRLRNALRYISRSNEDLFYSDTDAIRIHDSFDVNDPFADVIDELDGSKCRKSENNDAGAYQEKRASRSDDALGLMAKFTAEHHEALLKTRTTMKVDSNLNFCAEDLNTLKVNPPENTIDKELLIEINAQLDSCSLESHRKPVNVHIKNPVPAEKKEKSQQIRRDSRHAPINIVPLIASATGITTSDLNAFEIIDANAMSGIWNMIAGNSIENTFFITMNGYNIFNDKNVDWLKRNCNSNIDNLTDTQIKCQNWLQKSVKQKKFN